MPDLHKMNNYFYHETAIIETSEIGEGTKVWAWAHLSKGSKIGKNCMIGERVYIGPNVIIGDNCKIQNNSLVYEGVTLEDNVFFGPNTVTTNDYRPNISEDWRDTDRFKETLFKSGCSIGGNTVIICGVSIGKNSLIGAGSVVTKNIPDNVVAFGNPCSINNKIS
jgi:UDP-2-acetamido-3-amino-2,3-dideoxy-glucuronate N-acetyltransferase